MTFQKNTTEMNLKYTAKMIEDLRSAHGMNCDEENLKINILI